MVAATMVPVAVMPSMMAIMPVIPPVGAVTMLVPAMMVPVPVSSMGPYGCRKRQRCNDERTLE
jgi:hypothetical protein